MASPSLDEKMVGPQLKLLRKHDNVLRTVAGSVAKHTRDGDSYDDNLADARLFFLDELAEQLLERDDIREPDNWVFTAVFRHVLGLRLKDRYERWQPVYMEVGWCRGSQSSDEWFVIEAVMLLKKVLVQMSPDEQDILEAFMRVADGSNSPFLEAADEVGSSKQRVFNVINRIRKVCDGQKEAQAEACHLEGQGDSDD